MKTKVTRKEINRHYAAVYSWNYDLYDIGGIANTLRGERKER